MKNIFLLMAICFSAIHSLSQDFSSIIKAGDDAMKKKDFQEALNQYNAAAAWDTDPGKKNIVKEKIDILFKKISEMGGASSSAQRQIKKLLDTIQNQKEIIKAALTKAENLVNAFYFYDGRLALANKNGKFGFIDTTGKAIIQYRYEKSEQFDYTGFAKVQDIQEFGIPNTLGVKTEYRPVDYLIDTNDTQYNVVYRLEDLVENDEITRAEPITAVDLRSMPLLSFPPVLKEHPQLKVLILDGTFKKQNNLKNITSELPYFQDLRYLNLQYCKIDSLPAEIAQIDSLQSLNIKGNNLKSLPDGLTELKELKTLNLIENDLTELPTDFGRLKKLQVLLLTDNPIKTLPKSFYQLSSLRVLSLRKSSLTAWPAGLERVISLAHFNYSDNSVQHFPTELLQLINLETLDLSFNQIRSLPPAINALKKLKALSLRSNELSGLPAGFGELHNIETLDLSGNEIINFPVEITKLKSLKSLDLSFNRSLKSLPNINQLKNLRILRLTNTSVSEAEQTKIRALLPWCTIVFRQGQDQ